MKFSTITTALLLAATGNAWKLHFDGDKGQDLTATGTADVKCNNLASSLTDKIRAINWDPSTDFYRDPTSFTVYENRDCKGKSWTGVKSGKHTFKPSRKFDSYKLS